MRSSEILGWLQETDPERVGELYLRADRTRRDTVGDDVHLRALVEISSHCRRSCTYCGIRVENRRLVRYRMTPGEVVAALEPAAALGCGTAVLQAGEDVGLTVSQLVEMVQRIKGDLGLAVTLSLGERPARELEQLRTAGADRYLLRFETSNGALFDQVHPRLPIDERPRLEVLQLLRDLGYEVGSGVMVGMPGTSFHDLARDLEMFREFDLDMIGVGPYVAHPDTPMGEAPNPLASDEQVPADAETTCKVIALARLLCPSVNLPATTALATIVPNGRELGLQRGANVWMPNFTPPEVRELYNIYPGKAAPQHPEVMRRHVHDALARLGRRVGRGAGDSPRYLARRRYA
jgi:biotin synthase